MEDGQDMRLVSVGSHRDVEINRQNYKRDVTFLTKF